MRESMIYKELLELSSENPMLLKEFSLREFRWRKSGKLVLGQCKIVHDEEDSICSEDEEFYGRKTMKNRKKEVIPNKSKNEINTELKNYKKVALYSGLMSYLNKLHIVSYDNKCDQVHLPSINETENAGIGNTSENQYDTFANPKTDDNMNSNKEPPQFFDNTISINETGKLNNTTIIDGPAPPPGSVWGPNPPPGILGGPAPPPGLFGGPALPPGMLFGSNEKKAPRLKSKYKPMKWEKLELDNLKDTIWPDISYNLNNIHPEYKDLDKLFEDNVVIKKIIDSKTKVNILDPKEPVRLEK